MIAGSKHCRRAQSHRKDRRESPKTVITLPPANAWATMHLRPPGAWRGRLEGQHLPSSCLCHLGYVLHATPLGRYQEQRSVVRAPEHASEAPPVKVDRLQHLTAFADAHATPVGHVSVPDCVVRVEADAVGNAVPEACPHAAVRQPSVHGNVEGCEPLTVGLSD